MDKHTVTWNVYRHNSNLDKIEQFNIFNHGSFVLYCGKHIKKYKDDPEQLAEQVRRELFYYFGSKFEYEVLVTSLSDYRKVEQKIDIYNQVMMNWDRFFEYFVAHERDILRLVKKYSEYDKRVKK